MEDDSGRVTRSRRRLSVEQDSKHEDSPMNTPTKKRIGRLSIKPQLDNIVENEATPIQSPRRGKRKSVAPVTEPPAVEQDSADAVAHSRNTAVLDSPKPGKRVTRRTSVTGEVETAAPLTPLRRSRRISIEYNNVAEETAAETKTSKTAKNLKEIEPLIEENEKENTHNNTTLNNSVSKNKARLSEIISQKLEVAGSKSPINVSTKTKELSLSKSTIKDQQNARTGIEAVNSNNSTKNLASRRTSRSLSEKEENSPKSDDSPSRRSPRISAKSKTPQQKNEECSSPGFAMTHNSSAKKEKTTFNEKLVMNLQSENKPTKKLRTKSSSSVNNSISEIAEQNTQEIVNDQISDNYVKEAIISHPGPRVSLEKLPLDNLKTSPIKKARLSSKENDSSNHNKLQRLQDGISKIVDSEDDRQNTSLPIKSINITQQTSDKESKKSLNKSDDETKNDPNETETFKARKSLNISGMVESKNSFTKSDVLNNSKSNQKIKRSESKYEESVTKSGIEIEKSPRKIVDVESKISLNEFGASNNTMYSPSFGMVEVEDKIESVIYMEVDDDIPEEICTKPNNKSLGEKSTDLSLNSSKVKVGITICSEKNDEDCSDKAEKLNVSVNELNNYREIQYSDKYRSNSKLTTSKSMDRSILLNDSNQNMTIEDPNNVSATTDKKRSTSKLLKNAEGSKSLQDLNFCGKAFKKNTSFEELSQSTPTRIKQLKRLGLHTSTPIPSLRPIGTDDKSSSKSKVDMSNNESEHGDSDSDAISNKLYIDDEADDAGMDYESGDSLDEDEAERMKDGEIRHKGETLGSDTEEDSDDSEYEKDSFIVTSDEEDDELLSGDGDDLSLTAKELTQSAKSKKMYNNKKNKEQKKASREIYAARHSKDNESSSKLESDSDTEIIMKISSKKRNRIESEGNEEAEITCPNDSSNKSLKDPLAASVLVKTEPNSSHVKDVSISLPDKSDKSETELTSNLYNETEDPSTDEDSQKIINTYESLLSNLNKTPSDSKKCTNNLDTSQDRCARFTITEINDSSLTKNILIAENTHNDKLGSHEIEEVQVNENKSMFVNMDLSRDPFSNTIIKYQDVEVDESKDLATGKDRHKVDLQKYPSITETSANSGSTLKDGSRNSSLLITEVTSKRKPSLSGSFNKSDKWASISVTDAKENLTLSPYSNITFMDSHKVILPESSLDDSLSKKNNCGDDLRGGYTLMKNDDPDMSVKMMKNDKSFTSVTPNDLPVEKADLNEKSTYANQSSNSDTSLNRSYESSRSFKNALDSVKKNKKNDSNVSNSILHVSSNMRNDSIDVIPSVIGDSYIIKDSPKVNESILSTSNSDSGKKKKKKNVSFSLETNDPAIIDYVDEVKVSTNDSNNPFVKPFVNGDTSLFNESALANLDPAKKKNNSFSLSANISITENSTDIAVPSSPLNASVSNNTNDSTVEQSVNINENTIDSKETIYSTSSLNSTRKKKKTSVSVSVEEKIDDFINFNSPSNALASKKSNNSFIETLVNSNELISNVDSTIMDKKRKSFESKVLVTENSNEAAVPTSPSSSSKQSYSNKSAKNDTFAEEFDAIKKQSEQTSYSVEDDMNNEKVNVSTETTIGIISIKKKNKKNRNLESDFCEKSIDEGNTSVAGIFNVTANSLHISLINDGSSAEKKNNKMDHMPKFNMSRTPDNIKTDNETQFSATKQDASMHKFNFSKKFDCTSPEALVGPFLTSTEKKKKLKKIQLDSSLIAETHKGKDDSVVLFPEVKMSDSSNHSDHEAATLQCKKKKKGKSRNLSLFNVSAPLQTTDLRENVAEFLKAEDVDKSASPCYSESLSESKQKKKKKKKRGREHENQETQLTESQETQSDVFPVDTGETSHKKKKMKFTKTVKDTGAEELVVDNQSMRGKKRKATDESTKETFKTDKRENCSIRRLPATIIEQLNPPSKKSRTDFAVEVTSKRKAKPSTHLDQSILVERSPTCVGKTGQFVTVQKKKIMPSLPLVSASNFGATTQFNIVPLLKRPKNELRMDNLQFHMGSNFKEETLAKRKRTNMKELGRLQRSQFAKGRIVRK